MSAAHAAHMLRSSDAPSSDAPSTPRPTPPLQSLASYGLLLTPFYLFSGRYDVEVEAPLAEWAAAASAASIAALAGGGAPAAGGAPIRDNATGHWAAGSGSAAQVWTLSQQVRAREGGAACIGARAACERAPHMQCGV